MFSEKPGKTTEAHHLIIMDPGVKVKVEPYQIPEAKRKKISTEVKRMLEVVVMEQSHSWWSIPIVLKPKPDGTMRLCNDL